MVGSWVHMFVKMNTTFMWAHYSRTRRGESKKQEEVKKNDSSKLMMKFSKAIRPELEVLTSIYETWIVIFYATIRKRWTRWILTMNSIWLFVNLSFSKFFSTLLFFEFSQSSFFDYFWYAAHFNTCIEKNKFFFFCFSKVKLWDFTINGHSFV